MKIQAFSLSFSFRLQWMLFSFSLVSLFSFSGTKQWNWKRSGTWVGRIAVSRAERRWSKEPRMATMFSVLVWLLCNESLMNAALSLRASIACGTPIFLSVSQFSLTFFLSVWSERKWKKNKNKLKKQTNKHGNFANAWDFLFERFIHSFLLLLGLSTKYRGRESR